LRALTLALAFATAAAAQEPGEPLALRLTYSLGPTAGFAPYPRSTTPLIVAVNVNADPKGERVVRLEPSGRFLVRREDLEEFGQLTPAMKGYAIEGDVFVDLGEVPRARTKFDEKTLTLDLAFPPEDFPRQTLDLSQHLAAVDIDTPPSSALLNYRLAYSRTRDAGPGNLSLSTESAFAYRGWLLENRSFHSRSENESASLRLETRLQRDDRENLRRLTLGDSVTPGLALGSSVPFGGLTFAKSYALSPYLVRQPSVAYRGLADSPSQVDFYVGNTLVLRQRVAPGPFDIQNFSYYGGQRDVRVVIRDAYGRERTIAYPFYFADQGLAAGLHDYSYQAGWLRESMGLASNDYGPFSWSAFHQYGIDDKWTVGARTEGTADKSNAGLDAVYRHEYLGLFAAHAAASRDSEKGPGNAWSFGHSFVRNEISTQVIAQGYSRDYAILSAGVAPRLPKRDFSINASYATALLGSVSAGYTRLELWDEPVARSINFTYSRPLGGRLNFTAIARHQLSEPRGTEVFVGLQYMPQPDQNAGASWSRDIAGARTASLQFGNNVPHGEGIGYSLGVQRRTEGEANSVVYTPRLEWYARRGIVGAEVTHLDASDGPGTTGMTLSLSGALVAAEGRLDATRPVSDSFAIVELQPPMEGVTVYENNQVVGKTDARGRALLPNVVSYANNFASLRDKDISIEYTIDKVGKSFSPPARSGTLVPFRIERLRTFTGRFLFREGERLAPLEFNLATVEAGGRSIEVPTGRNGEFYAENLPAGRHPASVLLRGSRCDFVVEVPATEADMVALGDIITCHAPR
jgi:outer membrane usher protein